jgi:hypothetical protein
MKKLSPMKMHTAKASPKLSINKQAAPKGVPKASSMERYAQERSKKAKMAATPAMVTSLSDAHDPEYDLSHLHRAAEVMASPARHRAAKGFAMKKIKALKGIVGV